MPSKKTNDFLTEIKKKLESIFESYIDDIKEKIANMQMFDKSK